MKNPLLVAADRLRRLYWLVVRPVTMGVIALVVDDEGRVLLVRHTYRDGWYLPGGGVRRLEPLDAALRRELREEVGVEPQAPPRLHGVYWSFAERKSDHIAVFVVDRWSRRPVRSLEIADSRFYSPDALPEDLSPPARRRIAEHVAGRAGAAGPW
jgi:8-oxo-dGTP pyrophosphatase MutT (NUDIX family)